MKWGGGGVIFFNFKFKKGEGKTPSSKEKKNGFVFLLKGVWC